MQLTNPFISEEGSESVNLNSLCRYGSVAGQFLASASLFHSIGYPQRLSFLGSNPAARFNDETYIFEILQPPCKLFPGREILLSSRLKIERAG